MQDVQAVPIGEIKAAVSAHFGLTAMAMVSQRRGMIEARPRQIAMSLAHDLTPLSYPAIGLHFGNRDHTTVMYAVRVVRQRCAEDADFARTVTALREGLILAHAA